MSTLHLVRQSGFTTEDLKQCVSLLTPEDTIILMDDGTYNINHPLLSDLPADSLVKVISCHAIARGINIPDNIELISMADVVSLTLKSKRVITWQ